MESLEWPKERIERWILQKQELFSRLSPMARDVFPSRDTCRDCFRQKTMIREKQSH